jgi:hypothetical protein
VVVFCSAPYRADTDAGIAENVRRANAFSSFAVRQGYTPINLMPAILAGAYGPLDTDELMEAGIQMALEIVRVTAMAPGELWILRRPDGSFSSGCQREIETYREHAGPRIRIFQYDEYSSTFYEE